MYGVPMTTPNYMAGPGSPYNPYTQPIPQNIADQFGPIAEKTLIGTEGPKFVSDFAKAPVKSFKAAASAPGVGGIPTGVLSGLGNFGVAAATGKLDSAEGIGGATGGTIGGIVGSVGGPLGSMAGSTVGNFLGSTVGGLFGGDDEEEKRKEAEKKARRQQLIQGVGQNLNSIGSWYSQDASNRHRAMMSAWGGGY